MIIKKLAVVFFSLSMVGCFADSPPPSEDQPDIIVDPPPTEPDPEDPDVDSDPDILDELQERLSDILFDASEANPDSAQIFLCLDQLLNQLIDGPDRLLTETTNGQPQNSADDVGQSVTSLSVNLPLVLTALSGENPGCEQYMKPDGSQSGAGPDAGEGESNPSLPDFGADFPLGDLILAFDPDEFSAGLDALAAALQGGDPASAIQAIFDNIALDPGTGDQDPTIFLEQFFQALQGVSAQ